MDPKIGWEIAVASLSLALVLTLGVAWLYTLTYEGLSYSRGFTQSLALGGVLSAVVMLAIGNDIARGLGLMGALSLVRFRASIKEPRDLLFIFASQGFGVACGVQAYTVAVLGALVFGLATIVVSFSAFGSKHHFDAVLRLRLPVDAQIVATFNALLDKDCEAHSLLNLRDLGNDGQEHTYQLKFFDLAGKVAFVSELSRITGASGVTLLMQEQHVEV
jgi:uncharacterized membrane protein YhiD involved in acid resistance